MQKNNENMGLEYNASLQKYLLRGIGLSDLEAIRLILSGDSVIDWNRANFRTLEEVDRFLALQLIDLQQPEDKKRVAYIYSQAVQYLEEHLGLRFPPDIKKNTDVRNIFLFASYGNGFNRRKILSCAILKLMHVLQHLDAASLRYHVPLAEAKLLKEAEQKVLRIGQRMKEEGLPIKEFYGSQKSRNSLITKLLAKKEDVAATVFDKLRFRIVTETESSILAVLSWLQQNLFPFNYVIPGQTHNNLCSFEEMLGCFAIAEPPSNGIVDTVDVSAGLNQFSGESYRVINFIVDLPIRVDQLTDFEFSPELGRVVFVMAEFQIVDAKRAELNEKGDAAHELYKKRQQDQVLKRLRRGGKR